jgi:hypothetical protein
MQLIDWLLVEVSLLLIGLTKISLTKSGFTTICNIIASQAAGPWGPSPPLSPVS